jgi:hypothetical protein
MADIFGDILAGIVYLTNLSSNADTAYNNAQASELAAENAAAQATYSETEADTNISLYQNYLDTFDQSATNQEDAYKTKANEDLGDRLAAMGMKGISTTDSSGNATSASMVVDAQKSLYDEGYTTLLASLANEKASYQSKLDVYEAQKAAAEEAKTNAATAATTAKTQETQATNSVGGWLNQLGNWLSGNGWTM